jgi:hypothetical protein
MRRRDFIVVSSMFAASASGCLGAFGEPGDGGDEGEGNGTADDEAEPNGPDGDDGGEADAYTLSVGVEHPNYVVKTHSTFSNEMKNARRVEEFEEPALGYVSEAVEKGRADIDEPEDALLEAVEGVRHVRDGDDVYVLDHSLPEYVVTGTVADVSDDEVDEDRVVHVTDDIVRALGPDNRQIVMMRTSVVGGGRGELETGEYRTTSLSEELEGFLEETDYIAVSTSENPTVTDEYVELELSHNDPEEYYLAAESLTHEELFEVEEVRYPDELPDDIAEVFRTAVEGEYRGDTLPDGFEDMTGDAYFLVDDEAHRPDVLEPDYDAAPIEVSAEVLEPGVADLEEPVDEEVFERYREEFEDAHQSDDEEAIESLTQDLWDEYRPDDGAVFELTLANNSDETVYVFSGAPAPFGVLTAERTDAESDERRGRLVWSETYVDNRHVSVGPRGLAVNSIGLNTEIGADEQETEMYEVGFPPGEYRIEESVDVSRQQHGDGETYPYTVVVEVREASGDGEDASDDEA